MARYLQRLRHARRHQEIARCAALRSTNFGRVRGRVFTLFDVMWSAAQLLSLAVGAALVDVIGIRPVYWMGGRCWSSLTSSDQRYWGGTTFGATIEYEHEGGATVASHSLFKTLRLALTTGRIR